MTLGKRMVGALPYGCGGVGCGKEWARGCGVAVVWGGLDCVGVGCVWGLGGKSGAAVAVVWGGLWVWGLENGGKGRALPYGCGGVGVRGGFKERA